MTDYKRDCEVHDMAKKSIGGIDEGTKAAFDEIQSKLGAGSANEALAALIEGYSGEGDEIMAEFDEYEIAGVKEVKRQLANMYRQMVMMLSRRHDELKSVCESSKELIATLQASEEQSESLIESMGQTIEEKDATISELRTKAASVDALSERIEKMGERFDRQIERYEADLAKARADLDQMTSERDGLADALKSMTSERDTLASEVERLQAELAAATKGEASE